MEVKKEIRQKNDVTDVGPPVATALRDSACNLRGSKVFKIPEGALVDIIDELEDVDMYRIRFNGQTGIFPVKDF